jgi:multimeric flavodoxin WrbA
MHDLLEAALDGTRAEGLEDVTVRAEPALGATVSDVLGADGFLLGTPANIGYLSGAMKHFFDTVYYPCLTAKAGAPYGLYVHGNSDTAGAVRAAESITQALGWQRVHEPVAITGAVGKQQREAVWELAATVAAALLA